MFSIVFCSPIRHTQSGVHLSMDLVVVDDGDFVECCEWPVIGGVQVSRCPPGTFCVGECPPGDCCGIPDSARCASHGDQCCPLSAPLCCDSYCCNTGEKCCGGPDDGGCCFESDTCGVNSQQKKTCCEDENLCTDDSQSQSGDVLCCTNTEDDYCDLGEPGVIPPSCSFLRACIWDYPECEVSEPLPTLPLVDSSILQILISSMCDTNFDPNKCTEIIGTDCQKLIPDGWLHTDTNPSCQNQTTQPQVLPTELTEGQIYRVLRIDEIEASQVFAKDPTATYTVGGHVTQGDRLLTQYISASTDFETNYAYCRKYYDIGRKIIVVLDVARLIQNGCRVLEVSKGEGIKATNKRALNFARSQDEVLIVGALTGTENVYSACTAAQTQGAVIVPIECIPQ